MRRRRLLLVMLCLFLVGATFDWTNPTTYTDGTPLTLAGTRLWCAGQTGGPYSLLADVLAPTASYTVALIPPQYCVGTAYDGAGLQSVYSNEAVLLAQGGDIIAPSIPTTLAAVAASGSQINLSWTASTDNVGVTGYQIYRGGTQIATSATTAYADAGLSPLTSYTYAVAAFDAAGNVSAQSTSATATTLADSLLTGLIGWWKFDDGAGTLAVDSSSGGNPGTLTNGPTWVAGKIWQAVHLDGVNDVVSLGAFSLKGLSEYSIAAWVNSETFATPQAIYSERLPSSASFRAHFFINSATNITLYGRAQDSDPFTVFADCTSGFSLSLSTWYHLAAVFNSVSDVHALYLNGALCTSQTAVVSAVSNTTPGASPKIGARFDAVTDFLRGAVDDVRVYNRALSAQDVLDLYTQGSGAAPTGGATGLQLNFQP